MIGLMMLAAAAGASPRYTVHYPGTRSCGEWTANRSVKNDEAYTKEAWVNGFLTAYNLYGPLSAHDILGGTNVDGAYAWIDNYCREHPLQLITDAAEELIKALRSNRR